MTTVSITTLSKNPRIIVMTFRVTTFSVISLSITTLSITVLGTMTI